MEDSCLHLVIPFEVRFRQKTLDLCLKQLKNLARMVKLNDYHEIIGDWHKVIREIKRRKWETFHLSELLSVSSYPYI